QLLKHAHVPTHRARVDLEAIRELRATHPRARLEQLEDRQNARRGVVHRRLFVMPSRTESVLVTGYSEGEFEVNRQRKESSAVIDFDEFISTRRQMLLDEAERERLAAQLPKKRAVRLELSAARELLSTWLDLDDYQHQYPRARESGREDWGWSSISA